MHDFDEELDDLDWLDDVSEGEPDEGPCQPLGYCLYRYEFGEWWELQDFDANERDRAYARLRGYQVDAAARRAPEFYALVEYGDYLPPAPW